jgi:hypothetical protein
VQLAGLLIGVAVLTKCLPGRTNAAGPADAATPAPTSSDSPTRKAA